MAYRYHGRAQVSRSSPQAWGICDRCNFTYLLADLRYQYQYNGTQLYNTNLRVCDRCMDDPQPQFLNPTLPPDPMPVMNPRPPAYWVQEAGPTQTIAANLQTGLALTTFYLDVLDSNSDSILLTLTGSATRLDATSSMTLVGSVWSNTDLLTFTAEALNSANAVYLAVYDVASGGSALVSGLITQPQTVVTYNGLTIPTGSLTVQVV